MSLKIDLNTIITSVEEKEKDATEAYKQELLTCKSLHGIGYNKGKMQAFHEVVELLRSMCVHET